MKLWFGRSGSERSPCGQNKYLKSVCLHSEQKHLAEVSPRWVSIPTGYSAQYLISYHWLIYLTWKLNLLRLFMETGAVLHAAFFLGHSYIRLHKTDSRPSMSSRYLSFRRRSSYRQDVQCAIPKYGPSIHHL